ncbi:MAG: DUF1549 and DUF1553 domain-containing protein [Akkermansiaceae bacterium]
MREKTKVEDQFHGNGYADQGSPFSKIRLNLSKESLESLGISLVLRVLSLSLTTTVFAVAFPDAPKPKKAGPEPHWAFQMPVKTEVRSIDDAIFSSELEPVPPASKEVLLRRVFHVLTGLLPTEAQRQKFLGDSRSGSEWMKAVTEEALADPAFGERWARHWLDVARYADTKSAAIIRNENYPYAYTYRDWVVGAFNRDLPFDQFAHLQIAADLMDVPKSDLAALGFLNIGRAYQGGQHHLVIGDQIDVTMRGFMGLTVACARCHDHKSDPIPTADYYSLHAVFASSRVPKKLPIISEPEDSLGYRDFKKKRRELAQKVHQHVKGLVPEYEIPEDVFDFDIGKANRKLDQKGREQFHVLIGNVATLEATSPFAPARAMSLIEGNPRKGFIFDRGNPNARGEEVPRRFLKIFRKEGEVFTHKSGRLELAHRLTDHRNPLTARVWANRVWMHLTGSPLVDSPGDFGVECAKPLQLPLLDYLAVFLIENDWSSKALITHIMTSDTWQRSSQAPTRHFEIDPENRYLARANRKRKDLESWRDTALQVSRRLDRKMGGLPIEIDNPPYPPRRTLYGKIRRGYLPSLMRAFDFPGSEEASMKRTETITPMQALYLMNSPFLHQEARAVAKHAKTIPAIYEAVLQRPPAESELIATRAWLSQRKEHHSAGAWEYGYLLGGKFHHFPFAGQGRWSGSKVLPDAKLGWLHWNRDGGHPEADKAVVTSWTAPENLTVRFDGTLNRPSEHGNGITGKLMRSNGEILAEWSVAPTSKKRTRYHNISIKKGEKLWCVVDSMGNQDSDSFHWDPKFFDGEREIANAVTDFTGPSLPPRAQLAQALLLSNEFFYLD